METLRWIAVLPTAFIIGILAAIAAVEISRRLKAVKIVAGLAAGAIFVLAGGLMAPSHRKETMIVLAITNAVYAFSQARTLALAPGERVDWVSLSRMLGGLVVFLQFLSDQFL
jgi:hypothetical protein